MTYNVFGGTLNLVQSNPIPNDIIMSVICSPAAAMFASCSFDQTAKLWSTERVFPLRTFIGHTRSVNVSLSCLFAT